jgi:hypothetical protein
MHSNKLLSPKTLRILQRSGTQYKQWFWLQFYTDDDDDENTTEQCCTEYSEWIYRFLFIPHLYVVNHTTFKTTT